MSIIVILWLVSKFLLVKTAEDVVTVNINNTQNSVCLVLSEYQLVIGKPFKLVVHSPYYISKSRWRRGETRNWIDLDNKADINIQISKQKSYHYSLSYTKTINKTDDEVWWFEFDLHNSNEITPFCKPLFSRSKVLKFRCQTKIKKIRGTDVRRTDEPSAVPCIKENSSELTIVTVCILAGVIVLSQTGYIIYFKAKYRIIHPQSKKKQSTSEQGINDEKISKNKTQRHKNKDRDISQRPPLPLPHEVKTNQEVTISVPPSPVFSSKNAGFPIPPRAKVQQSPVLSSPRRPEPMPSDVQPPPIPVPSSPKRSHSVRPKAKPPHLPVPSSSKRQCPVPPPPPIPPATKPKKLFQASPKLMPKPREPVVPPVSSVPPGMQQTSPILMPKPREPVIPSAPPEPPDRRNTIDWDEEWEYEPLKPSICYMK